MSESVPIQPKPVSLERGSAEERALAQVEKWMAMIREINREQQELPKLPA